MVIAGELTMQDKMSFTSYLQEHQPKIWHSLVEAAKDGLVLIDEEKDSVTATNRLLLTYPDLHGVLSLLIDNWAVREKENHGEAAWKLLMKGLENEL